MKSRYSYLSLCLIVISAGFTSGCSSASDERPESLRVEIDEPYTCEQNPDPENRTCVEGSLATADEYFNQTPLTGAEFVYLPNEDGIRDAILFSWRDETITAQVYERELGLPDSLEVTNVITSPSTQKGETLTYRHGVMVLIQPVE